MKIKITAWESVGEDRERKLIERDIKWCRIFDELTDFVEAIQRTYFMRLIFYSWQDEDGNELDGKTATDMLREAQEQLFVRFKENPEEREMWEACRQLEKIFALTGIKPSGYIANSGVRTNLSFSQMRGEDLARREHSEYLEALVRKLETLLEKTQITRACKAFIAEYLRLAYAYGLLTEQILDLSDLGIDFERQRYGIFDPKLAQEIEENLLEYMALILASTIDPPDRRETREKLKDWIEEYTNRYGEGLRIKLPSF